MTSDDTSSRLAHAEQLLSVHRPQEALRVVAAVLAREPQNVTALGLAARAALDAKEPGRAREFAEAAVAGDPNNEYTLRLLALASSRLGLDQEACEAARGAVDAAPNSWATHYVLAAVSAGVPGMTVDAWEAARRAVELAPHEADAHAVLGSVAIEYENQVEAEEALREALRLDPNHAGAINDLGRLQMLRKDHFGAASHFAHAAASDVRLDVAVHNIDAAIAMAVGRIVFWVTLAVFIIGRFTVDRENGSAVAFGYVLLTVLVGLSVWSIVLVTPAMRGRIGPYLRLLPRRDRMMTVTVGLLVIGMVTLMVMCVLPPRDRLIPCIVGAVGLLASRLLLEVRARSLTKRAEDFK